MLISRRMSLGHGERRGIRDSSSAWISSVMSTVFSMIWTSETVPLKFR